MVQQPYAGPSRFIVQASRLHTLRHTTLGKTPLGEVSARAETFTSQHITSMSLAGLEPAIPATERLQSHALDRAIGDYTTAQA